MTLPRNLRTSGKTSSVVWFLFTFIRFENKLVDNYCRFPRLFLGWVALFNEPFICFSRLLQIPVEPAFLYTFENCWNCLRWMTLIQITLQQDSCGKFHLPQLFRSSMNQTNVELLHGTHFLSSQECAKSRFYFLKSIPSHRFGSLFDFN